MSCGCSNSSEFCGPPSLIPTVVAGPVGVDGKSAYQIWLDAGNVGTEQDFLIAITGTDGTDGQTGPTGPKGDSIIGPVGATGPQGANGVAIPLGFFAGVDFYVPSSDQVITAMQALPAARRLNLGAIPFADGHYLVKMTIKIMWRSTVPSENTVGDCFIKQEYSSGVFEDLFTLTHARIRQNAGTTDYGTIQTLDVDFMANLKQNWSLVLDCGADFLLMGAQATVFAQPSYVIAAPGFDDGLYQKILST